jgi:DNA-binding transcriptional regulator LsrR (DeoR family)
MQNEMRFKSREVQRIEAEHGQSIDAILLRLYFGEGLTQEQIAQRLGVSRISIIRWFQQVGIETRKPWAA